MDTKHMSNMNFWDLMMQASWPQVAVLRSTQEDIGSVVSFFTKERGLQMNFVTTLAEFQDHLSNFSLFQEPSMTLITMELKDLKMLQAVVQERAMDEHVWVLSTSSLSLPWPQIQDKTLTRDQWSKLTSYLNVQLNWEVDVAQCDLLELLQILQQARLGLEKQHIVASPLQGMCWDVLERCLVKDSQVELTMERIQQLSYAMEMIHQASSSPALPLDRFYFPAYIVKILSKRDNRVFIDDNLLPFYQQVLQHCLALEPELAAFFTKCWIQSLASLR